VQFFLYFVKDILPILSCHLLEKFSPCFQDIITDFTKLRDYLCAALSDQVLDLWLNLGQGFLFDFVTAIVSHHFDLSRDIKLFIVANHIPGLIYVDRQAINWHLVGILAQEQSIWCTKFKASLKL